MIFPSKLWDSNSKCNFKQPPPRYAHKTTNQFIKKIKRIQKERSLNGRSQTNSIPYPPFEQAQGALFPSGMGEL